jgi:hypothetical protein
LLGMLYERYLVNLPRLKRDKFEWCDTSSLRLRWLWCEWVGKLLGWKESRAEGHPDGLSTEVHSALRDKIFPIPKIERDEVGRVSKVAAGQCVAAQGGSTSTSVACCIHGGATAPGNTGGAGCPGKRQIGAAEGGGITSRMWLDGMREQGFLDSNNGIIWSANPALGLSAWAFKHLLAVVGATDPGTSHTASGDQGNNVELVRLASSYFMPTTTSINTAGSAGCSSAVRIGCLTRPLFFECTTE